MNDPKRFRRALLPAAVLAALLTALVMMAGSTAVASPAAGPRPAAGGLLPSLPGLPLPPLPTISVPALPLPTKGPPPGSHHPTTPPGLPGLPGLPELPGLPGQPNQPGQPGQPGPTGTPTASSAQPPAGPTSGAAKPDAAYLAGAASPGDAAAIITNDPAADLYPQPPVDPATTAQSRLVARLDEVQHRAQYLRNVLARTRADLAIARQRLDAAAMLITLLTAPGTAPAPSGGAIDEPQDPVLALSAAIASGEADLARSESAARSLQQQVNNGVHKTLTSSSPVPTAATTYGSGRLRRPVPGRFTSQFGNRFDPYYHVWQLHAGVDIGAASGTDIAAAANGRVTRAGWSGGYGNYTCIDHGKFDGQRLTTCYGHQSAILVRPGQEVSVGQVIGRVGSTGAATGPHLHFEVRLGGRPVDPVPWI